MLIDRRSHLSMPVICFRWSLLFYRHDSSVDRFNRKKEKNTRMPLAALCEICIQREAVKNGFLRKVSSLRRSVDWLGKGLRERDIFIRLIGFVDFVCPKPKGLTVSIEYDRWKHGIKSRLKRERGMTAENVVRNAKMLQLWRERSNQIISCEIFFVSTT